MSFHKKWRSTFKISPNFIKHHCDSFLNLHSVVLVDGNWFIVINWYKVQNLFLPYMPRSMGYQSQHFMQYKDKWTCAPLLNDTQNGQKYHSIYRVAQKPVNLKYSLVLVGMFRFKPANQFRTTLSKHYELCTEHGICNFHTIFVNSIGNKETSNIF